MNTMTLECKLLLKFESQKDDDLPLISHGKVKCKHICYRCQNNSKKESLKNFTRKNIHCCSVIGVCYTTVIYLKFYYNKLILPTKNFQNIIAQTQL